MSFSIFSTSMPSMSAIFRSSTATSNSCLAHFLDRLGAAVGFGHLKAAFAEPVGQDIDIGLLVIHQQQTGFLSILAASESSESLFVDSFATMTHPFRYFFTGSVMVKVVPCPTWLSTVIRSPELGDDAPGDIKPHAGALADPFRGEKGFEDARQILLGYPAAGIFNLDFGRTSREARRAMVIRPPASVAWMELVSRFSRT
jgi:hypothetical protein